MSDTKALIAAAYEAAENKAYELKSVPEDESHWSDQYIRGHAAAGIGIAHCIRALTPSDARAAYDAAIRAAKIEGMREALALAYHDNQKHPEDNRVWGEGGRPYVCEESLHDRITALIEETEKGGNKHGPLRTTKNVPV
jgi:hypothetical protein